MAEYIDKQAAIAAIKKDIMGGLNYESILKKIPSADVQTVKHGRWIPSEDDSKVFGCSECHEIVYGTPNYCPCCGAKMIEEMDIFDDLSDDEKLQADVLAKIKILIHEAEECPEWKATQALRCLRKELMKKLGWKEEDGEA